MDVVFKEGLVHLQGVKFGKKTWQKKWMVLFKPSSTGVGRLELYTAAVDNNASGEQRRGGKQKTPERKVVRLTDCLSVTSAPKESCPSGCTAFYLNTIQSNYTLASSASQDWQSALCLLAFQKDPGDSDKGGFEGENSLAMSDNDLYSSWETGLSHAPNQYPVTIQCTEASQRCQLSGKYLVSTEDQTLTLCAMKTGHVIYHWPYNLLRKFGRVEGGFSIEAGRRCESGEGVFIFLSGHGPQIFQTIKRQCSMEGRSPSHHHSTNRRSFISQLPALPPVQHPAGVPPSAEDDSTYSTINDMSLLSKPYLSNSKEALLKESESEDEVYHSLEAVSLDDLMDNVRRDTPPVARKDMFRPEIDNPENIYSEARKPDSSPLLMLRAQRQPPASSSIQPGCSAQPQAGDDMKEIEEANSSSAHAPPTENPSSFKQRLAKIISKDLARLQPPLPPALCTATFPQEQFEPQ